MFCVLCDRTSTLDCESPVTGLEMNRNWSDVPWMAAPDAVTVSVPPVVCSEPATPGLRMSWQVNVAGQFGSAGGVVVEPGSPKAYRSSFVSPT